MVDLTLDSTIDGAVHVFGPNKNILTRIFWICLLVLSIFGVYYYVNSAYTKWLIEPDILTKLRFKTYKEFSQFAVTICYDSFDSSIFNVSHIKERISNGENFNVDRVDCGIFKTFESFCGGYLIRSSLKYDLDNTEESVKRWEEKCSQMNNQNRLTWIELCSALFKQNSTKIEAQSNIEGVISRNVLTSHGPCSTFTTLKTPFFKENSVENDYNFLLSSEVPLNLSLESLLLLNSFPQLQVNSCNGSFKLIFHHPNEIPTVFHKYYYVDTNKKTKLFVKIKSKSTSSHVQLVNANIRKCYFEDEGNLKHFKHYSRYYCMLECHAEICNCSVLEVPSEERKMFCNLFNLQDEDNHYCREDYNHKFEECKTKCFEECNYLSFTVKTVEQTDLGSIFLEPYVAIYRESDNVEEMFNFMVYSLENFIADIGGYLGLFLGCSLISIIEVLFLIVTKCFAKLRSCKSREQNRKPEIELRESVRLCAKKIFRQKNICQMSDLQEMHEDVKHLTETIMEIQNEILKIQKMLLDDCEK